MIGEYENGRIRILSETFPVKDCESLVEGQEVDFMTDKEDGSAIIFIPDQTARKPMSVKKRLAKLEAEDLVKV